MLLKQIFESKGLGLSGRTCALITGYFHDKTLISKLNLRMDYYIAKILQEAKYLTSPELDQTTYKI